MSRINLISIPNRFHKTARLGCFFRLPLNQKNLSLASLLAEFQNNFSQKYDTQAKHDAILANMYDTSISFRPQIFGKALIYSATLNFVEPAFIDDANYTYESLSDLFFEMLNRPLLRGAEAKQAFIQAQTELLGDYQEFVDIPANRALEQFFMTLYQTQPDYAKLIFGSKSVIAGANLSDIAQFFSSLKTAPMQVITASQKPLLGEAEKQLLTQTWPNVQAQFATRNLEIINQDQTLKQVEISEETQQTQLLLGFALPSKENFYTGMVLSQFLGGDEYAILFQVIREKLGLVYSVDAEYFIYDHLLLISMGLDKSKVMQAVTEVNKQIKDVATGQIDRAHFDNVKKTILRVRAEASDRQGVLIQRELAAALRGRKVDETRFAKGIMAVTKADLQTLAQQLQPVEKLVLG